MFIVGNADNKADPTRFAWNGLVKRHVRDEEEYGVLAYLGLVDPNTTLANPLWMKSDRLSSYPTV